MSSNLLTYSQLKHGDIVEVQSQGSTTTGKVVILVEGNDVCRIETALIEFPDGQRVEAQRLEFDEGSAFRLVNS